MHRDNLHLLEEGQGMPREELDERYAREEFRRPRESLLNICTEFYKHCGPRLKILQNVAGEPRVTALELLDIKSHMRYRMSKEVESRMLVPSVFYMYRKLSSDLNFKISLHLNQTFKFDLNSFKSEGAKE